MGMGSTTGLAMAKRIELWPVDRLVPYERNARTHSPEQVAQIAASISEFGFLNPILVDSSDGILAGHGRLAAARDLGLAEVPVVVLDHLSEAQKRAYVLADNKLALNAGWDENLLRLELVDLGELDFDLSLIGFSEDELAELLPEIEELAPENADADAVPELPPEPVTKPGDLWILGKHRLMCGDSTNPQHVERLMDGGTAGLLLTDPPYGINISARPVRQKHQKKDWDAEPIDNSTLAYFNQLAPASIIWGGNYFGLPPAQCFYVWDKKQPEDFSLAMCELAWTNIPGPAKMFRLSVTSYKKDHPTQKPVELLEWCLAKADGLVLDPFGGSGSTLIACEKTNRHCRMMELDPSYCDVIVKRWQQFTGKRATLESTGEKFPDEQ